MMSRVCGCLALVAIAFAVTVQATDLGSVEVLLQEGSASLTKEFALELNDCDESIVGAKLDSSNEEVLGADGFFVSYEKVGCFFNMTIDINFNKNPGSTDAIFTITSDSSEYVYTMAYDVYGMVFSKDGEIVSGAFTAWDIASWDDTGVVSASVSSYFKEGDCSSLNIVKFDALGLGDPGIYKLDRSCPTVSTEGETGCDVWFSETCDEIFFRKTTKNAGCGTEGFAFSHDLTSSDGDTLYQVVNLEIDSTDVEVVLECATMPVDYYGFDAVNMNVHNFLSCDDTPTKGEGFIEFGQSRWELLGFRSEFATQRIGLLTGDAASAGAGANDSLAATSGAFKLTLKDGSEKSFGAQSEIAECLKATYGTDTVKETEPEGAKTKEVQLKFGMGQQLSVDKWGKIAAAISAYGPEDVSLVNTKTVDGDGVSRLGMVSLKRAISSRFGIGAATRTTGEKTVIAKISFEGTAAQVAAIQESADAISEEAFLYQGEVVYAGDSIGVDEFEPTPSSGVPAGVFGVIAAGVVGLLLLVLAIVYVVITDGDEATTESAWSEGGVSVDGVPVPSSRYYDAVVVDSYGRGEVMPDEVRGETPISANPRA